MLDNIKNPSTSVKTTEKTKKELINEKNTSIKNVKDTLNTFASLERNSYNTLFIESVKTHQKILNNIDEKKNPKLFRETLTKLREEYEFSTKMNNDSISDFETKKDILKKNNLSAI